MADQRHYYERRIVEGNTARRLNAVPARPERVQRPVRQPSKKTSTRKKKQGMDVVTCFILVASICATVSICLSYVKLQTNVNMLDKEVIALEKEIADFKKQNDVAMETVESSIDLDEVYKKATKELGMVHAGKKQVYTYEFKKSDRVRQFADIPSR